GMVAAIAHIDVALAVDRDTVGPVELPHLLAVAVGEPGLTASRKALDPKLSLGVRNKRRTQRKRQERHSCRACHRSPPACGYLPLSAPLLEIFLEIVEHLGAARDAFRVVLGRDADALDQRPDARDLGAAELVVLEVDIVDDLADGAQRWVLERAALEHHL